LITAQEVTGLNPVEVTNDYKGLQRCKPFFCAQCLQPRLRLH
jgi:hypothetical protein